MELGFELEELYTEETDAALGNGGLGTVETVHPLPTCLSRAAHVFPLVATTTT